MALVRRKALAQAALLALQVVLLLSVADALREQTWFTSSLSLTFTDGPQEGASLNITASVDDEGAHQEVDLFGVLRLLRWQNERDPTAVVPGTENASEDAFTVDLPGPSSLEEQGDRVWSLLWAVVVLTVLRGALLARAGAARLRQLGAVLTSGLVVVFVAMLIIGTPLAWASSLDVGARLQEPEVNGTWLVHVQHDASTSASLEGISYTFQGSGFDLGLIPSEDRAAAIETAPSAENTSRLAWEGEARGDLPVWQQDLVLWAGVAWFALPIAFGVFSRASIDAPRALCASGATEGE